MRLTELEPQFLKWIDDKHWRHGVGDVDVSIQEADGILFLCPVCFVTNKGPIGTHSVICWRPRVPMTTPPGPGRWEFSGTGYNDLTLTAGSSSIHLTGPGCGAHFHITNGEITP